jgi:hypothetical protein
MKTSVLNSDNSFFVFKNITSKERYVSEDTNVGVRVYNGRLSSDIKWLSNMFQMCSIGFHRTYADKLWPVLFCFQNKWFLSSKIIFIESVGFRLYNPMRRDPLPRPILKDHCWFKITLTGITRERTKEKTFHIINLNHDQCI